MFISFIFWRQTLIWKHTIPPHFYPVNLRKYNKEALVPTAYVTFADLSNTLEDKVASTSMSLSQRVHETVLGIYRASRNLNLWLYQSFWCCETSVLGLSAKTLNLTYFCANFSLDLDPNWQVSLIFCLNRIWLFLSQQRRTDTYF